MTIRDRLGTYLLRQNVASVNTYESIKSNASQLKYQDELVKGTYHDFWDNYSKKEVALNDAVGNRLTFGFMKIILLKMPKFVPNDEIQSEYIMDDVRQALEQLNIKPKLRLIGINCISNGWSHVIWNPEFQEGQLLNLTCKVLGFEECHPRYWVRSHNPAMANKILNYRAIFIPRPLGMSSIDQTLSEERIFYSPTDANFQHLTLFDYNRGYGYSEIQPVWDAITKLRERSNDEHFLKSLFMEVRYPASWTATKKAQDYVTKARKATRRRGLATEAVVNPQTQEDTGLPSVQFRPWGQGPQGQAVDANQASANLDGEWLRLLVNLGYSQVWATGPQAGALEGSEISLTRDDRADIARFSLIEPIFKKILEKLTQLGVMRAMGVSEESQQLLLSKKYRMQCWITWEYNDKAALQQAQLDHEMEMKSSQGEDRNAYKKDNVRFKGYCDECGKRIEKSELGYKNICKACLKKEDKAIASLGKSNSSIESYNNAVEFILMEAMRNNFSMPMTPVASSWIKKIGYDEGSVYMQLHKKTKKGIDTYEYNPNNPQSVGDEWLSSDSKGEHWWDSIQDKLSPAFKHGKPPSYLETGYGEELAETQSEETRQYKMEGDPEHDILGAGTTAEPLKIIGHELPQEPESMYQMPESMYNPATTETPLQTATHESILTPGYVRSPTSITGSKKVGPGAKRKRGLSTTRSSIVPYNATMYNSALITHTFEEEIPKMLRMGKQVDWSMSKNTAYNFLNLVKHLNSNIWRCNSIAIGNEMAFTMPLYYQNASGGIDVEYACPDAFKKVKNHTGKLYLYPNLGHEGSKHDVGSYERIGWNDDQNKPILKLNYDDEKIIELLTRWNKLDSNIMNRLQQKLVPEMSTEYFCLPKETDGKILQTNIHNSKGEPIYEGIAIVDYGNCNSEYCQFELIEEVK